VTAPTPTLDSGAMASNALPETKHTPGPWGDGNEALCVKIDRERPWASTVFRKGHDGSEANALVAMLFGATVDEAVANARLAARAPDLLAEVERLREALRVIERSPHLVGQGDYGDGWNEGRARLIQVARAALSEQEGDYPTDAELTEAVNATFYRNRPDLREQEGK